MKFFVIFLCMVMGSFSHAQDDFSRKVIEPIQKDGLLREKVFIHCNKSAYFNTETIWFSAYVSEDSTNQPSAYTTNLIVNLLDKNGTIIDHKDLFIKKGVGYGDFQLDPKYGSGNFYIQAFTNYMRNFGNETMYVQEIEVIDPTVRTATELTQNFAKYNIQFFPESGYLLEDAENSVGIKALINGKGFPFKGKIENSKGMEIATFSGNRFGMAKCQFKYEKSETYTAIIDINSTTQKIELPKAKPTGIIFSVDNSAEDRIKLILKTNRETLPDLKNESLALLFYRHNHVSEAVTLAMVNEAQTTQELFFPKDKLLYGINVITLFRNNQPVAERTVFVDRPDQQTAVIIEELKTANDSIQFKIQTIDVNYKPVATQLSVSILPKDSKNFDETQNIKTADLVSPYIKRPIENPAYYFNNSDSRAQEFLDLELLIQPWESDTLDEKILKINPKEKFAFERGFTLAGSLKKHPDGYDIGILSKKNELAAISAIGKDHMFSFENIYAYKNEAIKLTLIKKNAGLIKPIGLTLTGPSQDTDNYSSLIASYYPNNTYHNEAKPESAKNTFLNYEEYPNIDVLDEVKLKAISTKKQERVIDDLEIEMANNHNLISSAAFKGKKVTKEMETENQTVFDYFRRLNYIKPYQSNEVDSYYISLRSGAATLMDFGGKANPDGTFPPQIYINDVFYSRTSTIGIFKELNMGDVDEILVNKTGAGGGVDGTGGMIRIYLKKADHRYFEEDSKDLYQSYVLKTGFDRAQDYFRPAYNMLTKQTYNWTEIDWRPNLQTVEKGVVIIKIPINGFPDDFQIIVNGFSENGLLFHEIYKSGSNGF